MTAEQLINQLIETARRSERAAQDEMVRLKERLELLRDHRGALEDVAATLKQERAA